MASYTREYLEGLGNDELKRLVIKAVHDRFGEGDSSAAERRLGIAVSLMPRRQRIKYLLNDSKSEPDFMG